MRPYAGKWCWQWIAAVAFVATHTVLAQSYPTKPVRIVVPFPAGGLTDVLARGISVELTKSWGQQALVENKPGAATIIGTDIVAKSAPDGYTILMANDPGLSANIYLYSKLPYDPVKDFAPVFNIAQSQNILVANPSLPAGTLQELIALAKSKPGTLNYGSFGRGSSTHVGTEAMIAMTGIAITHVPFKGIADVLPAVVSGQIEIAFSGVPPALPLIRGGRVKPIAISRRERLAILPDVPTFDEAGLAGFELTGWFGFVVPAATPALLIGRLANDVRRIVAQPGFRERFITGVGLEPLEQMPGQFAEFLKQDRAKYERMAKATGIRLD